jgi:hypothetical protein
MGLVRIFNKYPLTHNKNRNIFLSMLWPIKTILSTFCLSGVRALPLAAGINVVGHYKWHFFLFLLLSLQLIANSPRRSS